MSLICSLLQVEYAPVTIVRCSDRSTVSSIYSNYDPQDPLGCKRENVMMWRETMKDRFFAEITTEQPKDKPVSLVGCSAGSPVSSIKSFISVSRSIVEFAQTSSEDIPPMQPNHNRRKMFWLISQQKRCFLQSFREKSNSAIAERLMLWSNCAQRIFKASLIGSALPVDSPRSRKESTKIESGQLDKIPK